MVLALVGGLAGCGSSGPEFDGVAATSALPSQPVVPTTKDGCRPPSRTELAAVRAALRDENADLDVTRAARVAYEGKIFLAMPVVPSDGGDERPVVLVDYLRASVKFLNGLRAINGESRELLDLPKGARNIPRPGQQALDCVAAAA